MPWDVATVVVTILTGPEYLRPYLTHVQIMAKIRKDATHQGS